MILGCCIYKRAAMAGRDRKVGEMAESGGKLYSTLRKSDESI
jgi:hypothetical protein